MPNFNESWYKWSFSLNAKMHIYDVNFYSFYSFYFPVRREISTFVPFKFWPFTHRQLWLWLIQTNLLSFENLYSFIRKISFHHLAIFQCILPFLFRGNLYFFSLRYSLFFYNDCTCFQTFYHVFSIKILKQCYRYHTDTDRIDQYVLFC